MSATSVLSPTEFQSRLERYLFERSEEWRAVRVGEKEVSEQAEIVRRFSDLFSREQMDALQEAEGSASGDDRELLYRLRKTCESGLISAQLAEREDELENRLLAERVTFHGESERLGIHAFAVVFNEDQRRPAASDGDRNMLGASVQRVFREFLHGGGRALHYLAGGDAVDGALVQAAYEGPCS